MQDRTGQQLGNYRLLRLLGNGGFAEVYLGEHLYLKSKAALKVLHTQLSQEGTELFLQEAQTLARLDHPHIVRVLDFAVQDGTPFLVMEYAPGGSLRSLHAQRTRLSLTTVVSYIQQVALALHYAHELHLIHRDIKPDNMVLGSRQEVRLTDFGLAVFTPSTLSGNTQVMDKSAAGTLPYQAPEQLQGKPQKASDQYALAVVAYEWLCGRRPFNGTALEIAMQHLLATPQSLREQCPALPPEIEDVVLRALAKEPKQRFASVLDFASALHLASQSQTAAAPASLADIDANTPFEQSELFLTLPIVPTQQQPTPTPTVTPTNTPAPTTAKKSRVRRTSSVKSKPIWKVPTTLSSLIGREQELATISTLLSRPEVRILTLLGPGGIGKSSLSLQVAVQQRSSFADGVCFVALAPIHTPDLVISTIARELGIELGKQSPLQQVKAFLQDKQMVLLLDNFEQVLVAAALIEDILMTCPRLKVVVTSRTVLRVQGEQLVPLSPLAFPLLDRPLEPEALSQYAAIALFLQRVRALVPTFQLAESNAQTIAEICVHLDGLPLAIELAAARIKIMTPQMLLARLSQRLQVLTKGPSTLPVRQQTLRNTIKWSYDLLTPQDQRLFRYLSVFVGSYTLHMAEALCVALGHKEEAIFDGIDSLVDNSLLLPLQQEEKSRFAMLETIREYGQECLVANGELEMIQQAHADLYLVLAEEAEPHIFGMEQRKWLALLQKEHDNLRTALHWLVEHDEQAKTFRLAGALWRFWWMCGYLREGQHFFEQILSEKKIGVAQPVRAKVLLGAGVLNGLLNNFRRAEVLCKESWALFQEQSDFRGAAISLWILGQVALRRGKYAEVRRLEEVALTLFRKMDDIWGMASSLCALAAAATHQGEYTYARQLAEESLALYRTIGDTQGIALMLWYLAIGHLLQGSMDQANILFKETLTLARKTKDRGNSAIALVGLGYVAIFQEKDNYGSIQSLFEESLVLAKEVEDQACVAWAIVGLGWIAFCQRNFTMAQSMLEEGLAILRSLDQQWFIPFCLEGLGCIVSAQGHPIWAAQLWGAANALRQSLNATQPSMPVGYEQIVATTRAQLTEETFTTAWTQGQTMLQRPALAAREAESN